jgi:membrane protease YdiL (CAAX protease family)
VKGTFPSRAWSWFVTPPADVAPDIETPTDADLRTVDAVGLRLPVRAAIVVAVATFLVLVDFSRVLLPADVQRLGLSPEGLRTIAIARVVLYVAIPLAIVTFGFRDRWARYGLGPGDVRAGILIGVAGCAVMTPIVLWFAGLRDVRDYNAIGAASPAEVVLTNILDLTAAEFLFRGFLMFTLIRAVGPLGVVIAVMPFSFGHLNKPVLELLSTVGGGLAYGWLAWRTRSILWGSIAHVYILSLVTLAAADAAAR